MSRPSDNKPAGCGIVELQSEEDVNKAMDLNGTDLDGRPIKINRDDPEHKAIRSFTNRSGYSFVIDSSTGRPKFCNHGEESMIQTVSVGGGPNMPGGVKGNIWAWGKPQNFIKWHYNFSGLSRTTPKPPPSQSNVDAPTKLSLRHAPDQRIFRLVEIHCFSG